MQESDATNREIKELQQRNNELQRLVDTLRNDCEELEEKHVIQTQKLREEMRALHNKHKQEAASLDTSHKVNVIWYNIMDANKHHSQHARQSLVCISMQILLDIVIIVCRTNFMNFNNMFSLQGNEL